MDDQEKGFSMRVKHVWIIFTAIVLLGLAVRLYGINLPLVESHQGRQAQTAMMTRNLYDDNMNIFCTRLDFLGNIPGYVIMEFPFMHGITALLYHLFGVCEIIGRLVSVAFSVGAMFLIYGLARRFLSRIGAFAALTLYAFSPMNIFFSRAFMSESSMLFFTIGAVYFLLKWLDKQALSLYVTAIIFAAVVGLTKPTAGIMFIPLFVAWFLKYRWEVFKRFDFWCYMSLAVAPCILWVVYAHYFNLINSPPFGFGDSWFELVGKRGIVEHWFDPEFYMRVGGSIILLLLTPLGFIGTVGGIFCAGKGKQRRFLYSWLGAIVIYFYALSGVVKGHIYYHLLLLPLAVIFFGFSVDWLLARRDLLRKIFKRKAVVLSSAILVFLILTGYAVGYLKYFEYMYENRMPYTLKVSEIIRERTPKNRFILLNQPIVMPAVETYYSQCRTWYFDTGGGKNTIDELERLRRNGATTYVAIDTKYGSGVKSTKKNKYLWQHLNEKYTPIAVTDHYLIFDIREEKERM